MVLPLNSKYMRSPDLPLCDATRVGISSIQCGNRIEFSWRRSITMIIAYLCMFSTPICQPWHSECRLQDSLDPPLEPIGKLSLFTHLRILHHRVTIPPGTAKVLLLIIFVVRSVTRRISLGIYSSYIDTSFLLLPLRCTVWPVSPILFPSATPRDNIPIYKALSMSDTYSSFTWVAFLVPSLLSFHLLDTKTCSLLLFVQLLSPSQLPQPRSMLRLASP